jgi:hypothetical protein
MKQNIQEKLKSFTKYLNLQLTFKSRMVVLLAALILIPTFFIPIWHLSFGAQQYPEGLELYIYSDKMVGGDDGNDLTEINVLNHYIGMAELREEDFTEFNWIPLIVGLMLVLSLRAVVIGSLISLVDIFVFMIYFATFSLWRFWYMLSSYGHNLDPKAAVKVEPFTPPMFGEKMVGQFTVESYPAIGTYFFVLFVVLIIAGVYLTYSEAKKEPA